MVKTIKPQVNPRVITNEDIKQYEPMIEYFIRESVLKNWNEAAANKYNGDMLLGNSGWTLNDMRQYMRGEVFIALRNYDPNRTNSEGKHAKESSFIHTQLWSRISQILIKLTRKTQGYGIFHTNIEDFLNDPKNHE